MTIEITDGNIARLEHAHRILCPYCGSVAAVVDVKGPTPNTDALANLAAVNTERALAALRLQGAPANPPGEIENFGCPPDCLGSCCAQPPGGDEAERQRGPRRSRATLKTEIVAFLAANPTATKEEVRKSVGGRSATVHSIIDEINTAPPAPPAVPPVKGPLQALWDVAEIVRQYASV